MTPVVLYDKNAKSVPAFNSLAAKIIGEEFIKEGFFDKLKRFLKLG